MKNNFTTKNAKDFRIIASREQMGFNAALRIVLAVWDKNTKTVNLSDDDKKAVDKMKEAAKMDGCTRADFSASFIIEQLEGTKYVQNGIIGSMIKDKESGEKVFTAKTRWTASQIVDYVRIASRVRTLAKKASNK